MATFAIDSAHTDISFSAKHMMVTTVRGTFHDLAGTLEVDEADPTRSTAEFTVQAASLNTGVERRDEHLRSADFFDTQNHPTIVVRSTAIKARSDKEFTVTADVTIRGETRPVAFDVEFLGFYTGMTGARRIGLTARTKLNRKDWGLNWNVALETGGWLVGDEIRIEVDVAAEEVAPAAETAA